MTIIKNKSERKSHSYSQKESASSESSPLDSENESPVEKSLSWDSKCIDLATQGSINQQFSLDSSKGNDSPTEKSSNGENLTENRQVWIPVEEKDDFPVLNWTRVRPSSMSVVYRKNLEPRRVIDI